MKFYDTNPLSGAIEITTKIGCQINCCCCPQESFVKRYKELYPDDPTELTIESFMSYIESIPVDVRIEFSGMSEPFLNKDCLNMILYARKKGHPIGMYSTLVGLTEDMLNKIIDIEFDVFCIHLPDADSNTKIEINENYLNVLDAVIKNVKGYKYFTFQGNDVNQKIKKMVVGKLQFSNIIYERASNTEKNTDSITGKIKCSSGCKDNVLLPNGVVLLCCQDYTLKYILGNIKGESYDVILTGNSMMQIFELMDSDESKIMCRNCYFAHPSDEDISDPTEQMLLDRNINMQWKLLETKNLLNYLKSENASMKKKLMQYERNQ